MGMTGLESANQEWSSPQWICQTKKVTYAPLEGDSNATAAFCTLIMLAGTNMQHVCADSTLQTLPAKHLVRFGSITASKNAVLRLEVEEVELLSGAWLTQGFLIPVCGEAPCSCVETHMRFMRFCFLQQ